MARPSFATQGGVRTGIFSIRGGTNSSQCPIQSKPSLDKCRCCCGDDDSEVFFTFGSTSFNVSNPSSIRLI
jgi:hypothetical protein